jgi:hypothetical protein
VRVIRDQRHTGVDGLERPAVVLAIFCIAYLVGRSKFHHYRQPRVSEGSPRGNICLPLTLIITYLTSRVFRIVPSQGEGHGVCERSSVT